MLLPDRRAPCTSQYILSRPGGLKVNNKAAAERTAAMDLALIELFFASAVTSVLVESKTWRSYLSIICFRHPILATKYRA